jgi:hypothetical protein
MINKKIKAYSDNSSTIIEGVCELIFNDAIASGTNEYVQITYLLVKDELGSVHTIRPRNVVKIID